MLLAQCGLEKLGRTRDVALPAGDRRPGQSESALLPPWLSLAIDLEPENELSRITNRDEIARTAGHAVDRRQAESLGRNARASDGAHAPIGGGVGRANRTAGFGRLGVQAGM